MSILARILVNAGRVTYAESTYCKEYNICTIDFKYSDSHVGSIKFDFELNLYCDVHENIRIEDECLLIETLQKFDIPYMKKTPFI